MSGLYLVYVVFEDMYSCCKFLLGLFTTSALNTMAFSEAASESNAFKCEMCGVVLNVSVVLLCGGEIYKYFFNFVCMC